MKKIFLAAALALTTAGAQVTPVQRAELNQMVQAFTGTYSCGNGKVFRLVDTDTPGPDGLFDYGALAGAQIDQLVNVQVGKGNATVKKVGPVPGGGKQVWLLTKERTQMFFSVVPAPELSALVVQACELVKVK
ncbi:hypothetical protein [Deinococcus marmoris]|uniref:Uncharacterized protein n=1 Tax=Deinococcus marmoris TaxID=249408 RepID=A0A1U7P305_9DEIO|nr:hypothetical protein [Deinococcus marmoris]OLV19544.1 hypothetical protein BOO71_0002371 [Deinococcus marmoris]